MRGRHAAPCQVHAAHKVHKDKEVTHAFSVRRHLQHGRVSTSMAPPFLSLERNHVQESSPVPDPATAFSLLRSLRRATRNRFDRFSWKVSEKVWISMIFTMVLVKSGVSLVHPQALCRPLLAEVPSQGHAKQEHAKQPEVPRMGRGFRGGRLVHLTRVHIIIQVHIIENTSDMCAHDWKHL